MPDVRSAMCTVGATSVLPWPPRGVPARWDYAKTETAPDHRPPRPADRPAHKGRRRCNQADSGKLLEVTSHEREPNEAHPERPQRRNERCGEDEHGRERGRADLPSPAAAPPSPKCPAASNGSSPGHHTHRDARLNSSKLQPRFRSRTAACTCWLHRVH